MNWKLISLVAIGLVLVFVSLRANPTCKRTTYEKTSYRRCVQDWFVRRCSTAYKSLAVKTCCTGYCGLNCEDRNECLGTNQCRSPQFCVNTPGSYTCACKTGYKVRGSICADVNECTAGTHRCSRGIGICTNTIGSYRCSCRAGYRLNSDRKTCSDINECLGTNQCSSPQFCVNTPGSYKCACKTGFEVRGSTCADVNECTAGTHRCSRGIGNCTNTIGSYRCSCRAGYRLNYDRKTCSDINECMGTNQCNSPQHCVNTPGSYKCACKTGYKVRGSKCADVDECTSGTHKCSRNIGICINNQGSYRCTCVPGSRLLSDKTTCSVYG